MMADPRTGTPAPPAQRRRRALALAILLPCALAGWAAPACRAAATSHLASVVVDADTGAVLHAHDANRRVRPASLAKLMTALLVMEDRAAGGTAAGGTWPVSPRAAGQPPVRLGLRPGLSLAPDTVLDALLVASANDAAVVAAEALAGDEARFVGRMNAAAARLGMTRTRFGNASGLPAVHHTTARDMAVLARHLWRAFPAERARYARNGITHAGRWVGTTNALIGSYRGARGMKTGFTCRAGFHLVAAAERDGRTLIAVVLGARDRDERDRAVRRLLDDAFATARDAGGTTLQALAGARGQGDAAAPGAAIVARPCLGVDGRGPSGWNIDVGVRRAETEALALARDFIRERRAALPGARAFSIARHTGVELHRAVVTGLSEERAREACLAFRRQGGDCVIFGPEAAASQIERAAQIRELTARALAASGRETRFRHNRR